MLLPAHFPWTAEETGDMCHPQKLVCDRTDSDRVPCCQKRSRKPLMTRITRGVGVIYSFLFLQGLKFFSTTSYWKQSISAFSDKCARAEKNNNNTQQHNAGQQKEHLPSIPRGAGEEEALPWVSHHTLHWSKLDCCCCCYWDWDVS